MSGGVVQLVATGDQDTWLTGKPEVSFYRSAYKRYTHYASSVERQVIQGTPIAGGISTVRIEKKGDLLTYVYLTARDSNGAVIPQFDWSKAIDRIELMIGGQVVDMQDFEYMTDIEPITGAQNYSQRYLNNMTGFSTVSTNQKTTFFPLKFFFCKDSQVAIPLVALAMHDVELRITWSANLNTTITFGPTTNPVLPSVPQAAINVASTVVVTGVNVLGSNVANVNYLVNSGALFPGQILSNVSVPDSNLIGTIQSVNPVTSNLVFTFSNVAAASSNVAFPANRTVNVYSPVMTAAVTAISPNPTGGANGTTQLTIASVSGSGGIQIGQYVTGLPLQGPVVVSNVNSATSITVSFPTQAIGMSFASLQVGLPTGAYPVIGFFPGTAVSTSTYAQQQYVCWANFIYLDQDERKFFAEKPQDLLITQVQRVPIAPTAVQELALAHPVKFIAFPSTNYSQLYANGASSAAAANYMLKTQINGTDVGELRHLPAYVDAAQYYSTPYGYIHNNASANVAIISYCLDTSKLQPTGTLNFSRLDTYRLVTPVQLTNGVQGLTNPLVSNPYLYAVNYNVLRIQNGMGSLLYAN